MNRPGAAARAIIPMCGFDSVPSDLGTWLLVQAMRERHGEDCISAKASFSIRGGVNGGTLASALNLLGTPQAKAVADPFLLKPRRQPAQKTLAATATRRARTRMPISAPGWPPFFMGPGSTPAWCAAAPPCWAMARASITRSTCAWAVGRWRVPWPPT